MLAENTVFVLGAAFSREVGLPLGEGLKQKILSALPASRPGDGGGDEKLRWLIDRQPGTAWYDAVRTIRQALPFAASIDNLVEHHQQDETVVQVAKWAIATAIAREEAASDLGDNRVQKQRSLKDLYAIETTGYHDLFRLIVAGVPRARLDQAFSRLKVITFNYDRTLEAFLIRAVAAHSALPVEQAIAIVRQATIHHAYGVLDSQAQLQPFPVRFAPIADPAHIPALAEGLRTFSEKQGPGEAFPIKHMVSRADRVIFLGCAFHRQNMELIRPDELYASEVYGTVYIPAPVDPAGYATPNIDTFSAPSIIALQSALKGWSHPHIGKEMAFYLSAMTCRQLIAQYGVRWTG